MKKEFTLTFTMDPPGAWRPDKWYTFPCEADAHDHEHGCSHAKGDAGRIVRVHIIGSMRIFSHIGRYIHFGTLTATGVRPSDIVDPRWKPIVFISDPKPLRHKPTAYLPLYIQEMIAARRRILTTHRKDPRHE